MGLLRELTDQIVLDAVFAHAPITRAEVAQLTGISKTTVSEAVRAAPLTSTFGRDATQYGVRPNASEDQTRVLQRAIDDATRTQVPLALPPGHYRTGTLRLARGTQLIGEARHVRLELAVAGGIL